MLKRFVFLMFVLLFGISLVSVNAIDESIRNIGGRLAIIGEDYNIYTYNFREDALNPISDDASATRRYEWPTWATDGRLAYFCCDLNVATRIGAEVFVSSDGLQSGALAYEDSEESIIYAYWSPADCGENCRDLAMLTNNVISGGLALEMLHDAQGEFSSETIANGGPFYYHWNSAGTEMVFHRNNEHIDIYNFAENDISSTYNISSGLFQAPAWSSVDNRILIAARNETRALSDLVVLENEEFQVLVSDISGLISFLWSPDGQYIAYRTLSQTGIGAINVIDATSGETIATGQNIPAISFFWSPDSSKIAYITIESNRRQSASNGTFARLIPAQDDSPTQLAWMILDVETDSNLSYSSFVPSSEMGYLFQYFDQFSPSHRLWSPDSRYLVYSDLVQRGDETIGMVKILDTEQITRSPQVINEGYFAVWSFE